MNENDELWVELRHEHIAKVIHTLGERVKELSSNAGAKLAKVRARARVHRSNEAVITLSSAIILFRTRART